MYAYAELNGATGKVIPAQATAMTIDVEGDNSLNWRAPSSRTIMGKPCMSTCQKQLIGAAGRH